MKLPTNVKFHIRRQLGYS